MGDYIHKPIVIYGSREAVEHAGLILRDIIIKQASCRELAVHDNLCLPQISPMANDICFLLIPGSGGREGGGIDQRWQDYIREWKYEVQDSGTYVQWVELELGECEKDRIKQTHLEFRQEFLEEIDP